MLKTSRLIIAGGLLGVIAWLAYRGKQVSDGDGSYSDYVDTVSNDLMEVSYRVGDVFMADNWINVLNSKGAQYIPLIFSQEQKYGMPSYLLARLLYQESRYRPEIINGTIRSSAGAVGIAQIIPKWHPDIDGRPGYDATMDTSACLNPSIAIPYAAKYLATLKGQFGTWELALKAYNWGPGNVKKWLQGQLSEPLETRNYSSQILAGVAVASGVSVA